MIFIYLGALFDPTAEMRIAVAPAEMEQRSQLSDNSRAQCAYIEENSLVVTEGRLGRLQCQAYRCLIAEAEPTSAVLASWCWPHAVLIFLSSHAWAAAARDPRGFA
jgi:hypothetical protein